MTVVSLVSRERCEAVSVVLPVSCVGGRAGDGGDVSLKRGANGGDGGAAGFTWAQ